MVVTDMDLTELGCNASVSDNAVIGCCRYVGVVVAHMDIIELGCIASV